MKILAYKHTKKIAQFTLLLILIISSISTSKNGGDFDVYLDAAQKLYKHQNIYLPPFINGLQYYYSPFFAWILIPFSNHFFLTEISWSLLSYFLLYRTYKLISNYFEIKPLSNKKYYYWRFFIVLLSFQFILYNVAMIQITFFLMWAIFESLNYILNGKNVIGGIILGLAINIKLMPILILPYLFYRGYFKAIIIIVLTFLALMYIPSISLGLKFNNAMLIEWWKIINPTNKEHLFETGIGTHSLVALIPVYLTDTIGEMNYQRNFLNLSHYSVEMITNISRVGILILSLAYFKSMPFKKEENKIKTYWEISYFVLIIPLLLPHQQKYAFILVMPMITYLLYFFINTYNNQNSKYYNFILYTFIICLLIFTPLYGSDIIGKFLFDYTQHFRFLTISTLILIPISIYCSPQKIHKLSN
jgi:hypothetical protein